MVDVHCQFALVETKVNRQFVAVMDFAMALILVYVLLDIMVLLVICIIALVFHLTIPTPVHHMEFAYLQIIVLVMQAIIQA